MYCSSNNSLFTSESCLTASYYTAAETQHVLDTAVMCNTNYNNMDEAKWDAYAIDYRSDNYCGDTDRASTNSSEEFSVGLQATFDDDTDCDDDSVSIFSKSLLGSELINVANVVTYPQPGVYQQQRPNLNSPPSVASAYDYEGEYADYRYVRGILDEFGSDSAALVAVASISAEMSDGSKMILRDLYNEYHIKRTGLPAFDADQVSDDFKLNFMDAASAESKHMRHLTKAVEEKLNMVYYERDCKSSKSWPEEYDDAAVALGKAEYITKLSRHGKRRVMGSMQLLVRDDMPEDPHAFSRSEKGFEAARALQEYQSDDEQLKRKYCIPRFECPHFEDGRSLSDIPDPEQYHPLHKDPGQNDYLVEFALASLNELGAHPEFYEWQCANNPEEIDCGSGILRRNGKQFVGVEHEDIINTWNLMREQGEWTGEALYASGLLDPEDPFGDNPEYLNIKLMWWKRMMGISGLEALVHYHCEHIQALRHPISSSFFLSIEEEYWLNEDSADYGGLSRPIQLAPFRKQVYDDLHAAPIDWVAKLKTRVEDWLWNVDGNPLPHSFFDHPDAGMNAYKAPVEYQDSREPDTESHCEIEHWCRPQYLAPAITMSLRLFNPPPGLTVSLGQMAENRVALKDVVSSHCAAPHPDSSTPAPRCAQKAQIASLVVPLPAMAPPPGLNVSSTKREMNCETLANVASGQSLAPPPGINVSPAVRARNTASLKVFGSNIPSPPSLVACSCDPCSSDCSSKDPVTWSYYPQGYYCLQLGVVGLMSKH